MKIFLGSTPKELNEIQLIVIFWQEDAIVPKSVNCLVNQGLLLLKIWLILNDFPGTTMIRSARNIGILFLAQDLAARYHTPEVWPSFLWVDLEILDDQVQMTFAV